MIVYLDRMRLSTSQMAAWIRSQLSDAVSDLTAYRRRQAGKLGKRKSELMTMQDRFLNAYLAGTVEEVVCKAKANELKAEAAASRPRIGRNGASALRLVATGGRCVATFKPCPTALNLGFGLFKPHAGRCKPSHPKEKAVRRLRRTKTASGRGGRTTGRPPPSCRRSGPG